MTQRAVNISQFVLSITSFSKVFQSEFNVLRQFIRGIPLLRFSFNVTISSISLCVHRLTWAACGLWTWITSLLQNIEDSTELLGVITLHSLPNQYGIFYSFQTEFQMKFEFIIILRCLKKDKNVDLSKLFEPHDRKECFKTKQKIKLASNLSDVWS